MTDALVNRDRNDTGPDERGPDNQEAGNGEADKRVLERRQVVLPEEITDDVRRRLRRVEGQVRGIIRLLDQGADCREVVTQLSAATRALEKAGFRLVGGGLLHSAQHPEEKIDLAELERLFMKLS